MSAPSQPAALTLPRLSPSRLEACAHRVRPTAVSSESMRASLPSTIALATSATSARVGVGESTIE